MHVFDDGVDVDKSAVDVFAASECEEFSDERSGTFGGVHDFFEEGGRLLGYPQPDPERPKDREYYDRVARVAADVASLLDREPRKVTPPRRKSKAKPPAKSATLEEESDSQRGEVEVEILRIE